MGRNDLRRIASPPPPNFYVPNSIYAENVVRYTNRSNGDKITEATVKKQIVSLIYILD